MAEWAEKDRAVLFGRFGANMALWKTQPCHGKAKPPSVEAHVLEKVQRGAALSLREAKVTASPAFEKLWRASTGAPFPEALRRQIQLRVRRAAGGTTSMPGRHHEPTSKQEALAAVLRAVEAGDLSLCRQLLTAHNPLAVVRTAAPDGRTALHAAAAVGHAGLTELLLLHGSRLDARDAAGRTPLHAAASGNRDLAVLLKARADPHAADHAGRTALHAACADAPGPEACVALLAACAPRDEGAQRALLEAQDRKGRTALHACVDNNHIGARLEVVKQVVERAERLGVLDTLINTTDYDGRTALNHAAHAGRRALSQYLCAHRASPHAHGTIPAARQDLAHELALYSARQEARGNKIPRVTGRTGGLGVSTQVYHSTLQCLDEIGREQWLETRGTKREAPRYLILRDLFDTKEQIDTEHKLKEQLSTLEAKRHVEAQKEEVAPAVPAAGEPKLNPRATLRRNNVQLGGRGKFDPAARAVGMAVALHKKAQAAKTAVAAKEPSQSPGEELTRVFPTLHKAATSPLQRAAASPLLRSATRTPREGSTPRKGGTPRQISFSEQERGGSPSGSRASPSVAEDDASSDGSSSSEKSSSPEKESSAGEKEGDVPPEDE